MLKIHVNGEQRNLLWEKLSKNASKNFSESLKPWGVSGKRRKYNIIDALSNTCSLHAKAYTGVFVPLEISHFSLEALEGGRCYWNSTVYKMYIYTWKENSKKGWVFLGKLIAGKKWKKQVFIIYLYFIYDFFFSRIFLFEVCCNIWETFNKI